MENFSIQERGDLVDMVEHMDSEGVGILEDMRDEVPNL
jgi:hypothetical protein